MSELVGNNIFIPGGVDPVPAQIVTTVTPETVKTWIATIDRVADVVISLLPVVKVPESLIVQIKSGKDFVDKFVQADWFVNVVVTVLNQFKNKNLHQMSEEEIKMVIASSMFVQG